MGRWLKIKTICERSDTSPRTVRKWIRAGLRHSRINGTVYVKEDWLDEFMEAHAVDNQQVDQIVQDVVKEFLK
jgi:predicted site-specific integrase-resolvase